MRNSPASQGPAQRRDDSLIAEKLREAHQRPPALENWQVFKTRTRTSFAMSSAGRIRLPFESKHSIVFQFARFASASYICAASSRCRKLASSKSFCADV